MLAQKVKISVLGLALSLTLVGCGPAFKSNGKGKAGPAALSKAGDKVAPSEQPKSPQQLLEETQERLKREADLKAANPDGTVVESNDQANLYILGVEVKRQGEELVFRALVKENSQDNKGSIEVEAPIPVTAVDLPAKIDASKINLQTIQGTQTEVEPKAEEYTLTATCQTIDCAKVNVRIQRKNEILSYAADFTFETTTDKAEGTLVASSLKDDNKVKSYNEALIEAGVETERAESEVSSDSSAATEKPSEATAAPTEKPDAAATATPTPEEKATAEAADAGLAQGAQSSHDAEEAAAVSQMTVQESNTAGTDATRAAQAAADPKAQPSKTKVEISREIAVKEAQRQRQVAIVRKAEREMYQLVVELKTAQNRLTQAKLDYMKTDTGLANFFGSNIPAKAKADQEIIDAKNALSKLVNKTKTKTTDLKKLTGDLKTMTAELKGLQAQLGAAK